MSGGDPIDLQNNFTRTCLENSPFRLANLIVDAKCLAVERWASFRSKAHDKNQLSCGNNTKPMSPRVPPYIRSHGAEFVAGAGKFCWCWSLEQFFANLRGSENGSVCAVAGKCRAPAAALSAGSLPAPRTYSSSNHREFAKEGQKERGARQPHKRLLYCFNVNRTSLDHLLLGKKRRCRQECRVSRVYRGLGGDVGASVSSTCGFGHAKAACR
jgi:hypothetical protein